MSFRMWLESLLEPDVTVEGRPVRAVSAGDLFGFGAMLEVQVKAAQAVAEHQQRQRECQRERQRDAERKAREHHDRLMAEIRAAQLATQDRPPVRKGRDL